MPPGPARAESEDRPPVPGRTRATRPGLTAPWQRSPRPSLANHQYFEGVRDERRAPAAGRRYDLCRRRENAVGLVVNGDRSRAALGRDVLDDVVLTPAGSHDRQRAVA